MEEHLSIVGIQPPWCEHRIYSADRELSRPPSDNACSFSKGFFSVIDSLLNTIESRVSGPQNVHPILLGSCFDKDLTVAESEEFSATGTQAKNTPLDCKEADDVVTHCFASVRKLPAIRSSNPQAI